MTGDVVACGDVDWGLWKVSPSQIQTWRDCQRKWGYEYIDGLKRSDTRAAFLGRSVHAWLEAYFSGVEIPDLGKNVERLAKALIAGGQFPTSQSGMFVEREGNFVWGGVHYRGKIDLMWRDHDGVLHISDHKTSSDPVLRGLKSHTLVADPQALVYGIFGMMFLDTSECRLQWTYVRTKGAPLVIPVRASLSMEDAQAHFVDVHKTGLAICDARKNIEKAEQLPANPASCGKYGGCPHAAYCPRTLTEIGTAVFGTTEGDTDMGLKERLAARKIAPPRPEELGRTVNSPEAPKNPEVAREVSLAIGETQGTRKQKGIQSRAIANAAIGIEEPQKAKEVVQRVELEPIITWGEPVDWDPQVTPKKEQILAWVATKTFTQFTSVRAQGSQAKPFAHGRTLKSLQKNGHIGINVVGTTSHVTITDEGRKHFRLIDDESVWASPGRHEQLEPDNAKEESPEPVNLEGSGTATSTVERVTVHPVSVTLQLSNGQIVEWRVPEPQ